ncbi:hypothetical protein L1987_61085 [Smallanthus sonchifolius]|uniref:Uncharacterized protein n=1 Tax=Smallanthus sonchifolius TaxID=185202 RepID=A0ACB9D9S3_9ASTR|nr:hypothetical protein L1987_61085 [Smallanthus sonchifolius]
MAFGNVISFDATFNTNKYKMVFVPFTGIDNHYRNVSVGVGFLASETIESYKWLLNQFLKSFGSHPKVVVTDQDPAMKQAIEQVFTESRHRLCIWHIMKKVADKVGNQISIDASRRDALQANLNNVSSMISRMDEVTQILMFMNSTTLRDLAVMFMVDIKEKDQKYVEEFTKVIMMLNCSIDLKIQFLNSL